MTEAIVQVSPLWVLPAAALLGVLALAGAAFEAVLTRTERAAGSALPGVRRPGGSAVLVPLAEVARLLRQRRRITVAADALLWRKVGS